MASNRKTTLCVYCLECNEARRNPVHVIHPVSGLHMLFDERGEAICPICHVKWRREHNVMAPVH